jgi:hypothetical protein
MTAFQIIIRKSGEEGHQINVRPETTISEIKAQERLQGIAFRFKGQIKDATTMAAMGIKPGEIVNVYKTAPTGATQSALRLKSGKIKRSYNHAQLHAASTGTVVEAVMSESQRVAGKIEAVNEDTKAIREDVQNLTNILRRENTESDEGRPVKELLAEGRMAVRQMQNRVKNLNEQDKKRQRTDKQEILETMQEAADIARSSKDFCRYQNLGELTAAYKAQVKILKTNENAEKRKAKAKAKAKAKQEADEAEMEEEEEDQLKKGHRSSTSSTVCPTESHASDDTMEEEEAQERSTPKQKASDGEEDKEGEEEEAKTEAKTKEAPAKAKSTAQSIPSEEEDEAESNSGRSSFSESDSAEEESKIVDATTLAVPSQTLIPGSEKWFYYRLDIPQANVEFSEQMKAQGYEWRTQKSYDMAADGNMSDFRDHFATTAVKQIALFLEEVEGKDLQACKEEWRKCLLYGAGMNWTKPWNISFRENEFAMDLKEGKEWVCTIRL